MMSDLKESIKLKLRIAFAGVGCHKCEKSNEEDFSAIAASENIVNTLADDILKDMQKYDKYRWHDLRKDPNDLPPEGMIVEIVMKCCDESWYGYWHEIERGCGCLLNLSKGYAWNWNDRQAYVGTDKAWTEEKYKCLEVIAWKYQLPFKESE